ncbi:MAG: type II secretion system F family protein [Actinomycetota bacterium]
MSRFSFIARAEDGTEVKGQIESDTLAGARLSLAERKLEPIEVQEKKRLFSFEISKKKIPRTDIMHFSRQLAAFIRAGIPILDAMEVIGEESGNPALRQMLREVREALRGGSTLSAAIGQHGRHFPTFYVDMLRSAEMTGHLDQVLDQLSRYIERDLEARRKIRSALAYPMVILVMSVVTVVILTAFVLPRFEKFFESLDAQLPLTTRMLLSFSRFVSHWWWALFLGGLLLGTALYLAGRTTWGRELKDKSLLRFPVAGEVVRYSILERFCRILGSMVQAGVPLPEAMEVVAEGTKNIVYERGLAAVRNAMLQGEGISRPMVRSQLFPPSVTQMVRVGEDTGTLDEQLATAAAFYDQELDYKIKRLTTLFEPVVIIFMGLVVGFVAVALISAMYGIFNQTGKI